MKEKKRYMTSSKIMVFLGLSDCNFSKLRKSVRFNCNSIQHQVSTLWSQFETMIQIFKPSYFFIYNCPWPRAQPKLQNHGFVCLYSYVAFKTKTNQLHAVAILHDIKYHDHNLNHDLTIHIWILTKSFCIFILHVPFSQLRSL